MLLMRQDCYCRTFDRNGSFMRRIHEFNEINSTVNITQSYDRNCRSWKKKGIIYRIVENSTGAVYLKRPNFPL